MEASRKKPAKGVKSNHSSSSFDMTTNLRSPILMEILCRLPIKTLTASKNVCKLWLHLIGDPHFFQLHQARAPTEICFRTSGNGNTTKLHLGNFHSLNDIDFKLNTLEFPRFTVRKDDCIFVNACNGLLCYHDERYKDAMVWNPCTSEFITFPESHEAWGTHLYGLGFSTKANKFKLLRIFRERESWVIVAKICTIEKAYSWKTVCPCVPDDMIPPTFLSKVTLFRGTLHWIGSEIDSHECLSTIQTFDFEDDLFGRLPLSPYFDEGYSNGRDASTALGELAGCLALTDHTKEGVNIWLMKEYGVQDSWTKLFCLGLDFGKRVKYKLWRPVTYMDNGEILMTCTYSKSKSKSADVCLYNPILKSVTVVGSGPASLEGITYRPSLVLLKDSMLGYEVCSSKMSASPDWWKLVEKSTRQKHGSKVLEELRKDRKQRQELEERLRNEVAKVEQLKQQNQQLEKRLHDEHAKVEQLKLQNQRLEKRLEDGHAKVGQYNKV